MRCVIAPGGASCACCPPAPKNRKRTRDGDVVVKSEITEAGERELKELELHYCRPKQTRIPPDSPFYSHDEPPEDQLRETPPLIDDYPQIKDALTQWRHKRHKLQRLLLLRALRVWEAMVGA